MNKYLFMFLLFLSISFSEEKYSSNADCTILKDENSIICSFETMRSDKDEDVLFQWINPQGIISRQRNMVLPAGHGSIYDFRYIEGRAIGVWTFTATYKNKKYSTTFDIKEEIIKKQIN